MVQEGFPFFGLAASRRRGHPGYFDPWSRRNMNPSPATTHRRRAPRATCSRCARPTPRAWCSTGSCRCPRSTTGSTWSARSTCTTRTNPLRVRKRVMRRMGHSDHLVIWFTDTMPGVPKARQSYEAIAVMDEWMAAIRANPQGSIAAEPSATRGRQLLRREGQTDLRRQRRLGRHHRRQAQGAVHASVPALFDLAHRRRRADRRQYLPCALKPIEAALADGTYAQWRPNAREIATLKQIFPEGVCDYAKPDEARPVAPVLDAQQPAIKLSDLD